jgi:OmcA/MtrC family decaheme c-type cytochrome
VTNSAPGAKPTVRFSIKDDQGNPIEPSAMAALSLVVAGKTVDFSEFFFENAFTAQGNAGTYLYTLQRALPENAQGSWAVGIEGYRNVTLLPNTQRSMTVRDAGENKVFYFPVTDTQAVPRRAVVAQAKCDGCHYDLEVHGSRRNDVSHCVLCHNTTQTDAARRPAAELPAESVNFKTMIHKIHTGEELQIPFTVYGFGGNAFDFTEVRFPGDRRDCTTCHIDGTEQLPLQEGVLATNAPRDFIDPMPPISGACLSCHTTMSAAAHADVNTSSRLGEACATCHGPQAEFSIDRVHAR